MTELATMGLVPENIWEKGRDEEMATLEVYLKQKKPHV